MDIQYILFLQKIRDVLGTFYTEMFLKIAKLGETSILFPIIACIFWCGHKKLANRILYTICMGSVVNSFIRLTACICHPWLRDLRIVPEHEAMTAAAGYSFPSGHATMAVGFKQFKSIVIPCVIAFILVGFSCNYLGVNTPQDVIVSFFISGVFIIITWKLFVWAEKSVRNAISFVLVTLAVGIILIIYAILKSYPLTFGDGTPTNVKAMINDSFMAVGTLSGFMTGWLIERNYIKFKTPVNKVWLIPRCVYGIMFISITETGFTELLADMDIWVKGFTINFTNLFVITTVYPVIFKVTGIAAKKYKAAKNSRDALRET